MVLLPPGSRWRPSHHLSFGTCSDTSMPGNILPPPLSSVTLEGHGSTCTHTCTCTTHACTYTCMHTSTHTSTHTYTHTQCVWHGTVAWCVSVAWHLSHRLWTVLNLLVHYSTSYHISHELIQFWLSSQLVYCVWGGGGGGGGVE